MRYGYSLYHTIATLLLFFVLQGVAITFITRNTIYQQAGILGFVRSGHYLIWEYQENIVNYFNLKTINQELAAENTRLRAALFAKPEAAYQETTADSLFAFIGAEVVFNGFSRLQNYIVINKGSDHGVAPNMGVIGDRGVIGIVQNVNKHYASVLSILNPRFQINVRVGSDQTTGSLYWDGKSIRTVNISNMPQHSKVFAGDTVVTSGFSRIFPARIPLGIVTATTIKKGTYMDATVALFQNFNTLQYVNVIRSLQIEEVKELLQDYE